MKHVRVEFWQQQKQRAKQGQSVIWKLNRIQNQLATWKQPLCRSVGIGSLQHANFKKVQLDS